MTALLLAALIAVESSGNPAAIGDNGDALGILQIHACVVIDVNRIAKTNYTHRDAFDPEKAREMCRIYLEHYVTERRLGRPPTMADYARVWNGGPNGYRKPATAKYWEKVRSHLEP